MLIANKWKEYTVLDAGDGAKLEKWGKDNSAFIVSRPDPQIIWPKSRPELWTKADANHIRSNNGSGKWIFKKEIPDKWQINYDNLRFWISPSNFKHMGIFPEQAVNWEWITDKVKGESTKGKVPKVLNLFAYTGAATIACAKAGANVTHVDSAKGIVGWAGENARLNGIEARWIVDDVFKFVNKEEKRGIKYDAIIMDPPSYGHGAKGETWKIEKMLWPLLIGCKNILADNPLFFLMNTYSTGLGVIVAKNTVQAALGHLNGSITSDEIVLPIDSSNMLLPAGVTTRWSGHQ